MTDIEEVRLISGDKIVPYVFGVDEIQYFLTAEGSVNLAAAALLEAWAASYSTNPDSEHVGDYSYTQKIVDKMLDLAKRLREKEATKPVIDWGSFNFTDTNKDEEVE